jgi:hypothetical protein
LAAVLAASLVAGRSAVAQSDCVAQYRLVCPSTNIHGGDETTLTLQMRITGSGQTTVHAISAVVTTVDPEITLDAATVRETIVPPDALVPLTDIIPENRVYRLPSGKQVLALSIFLQLIGDLRVDRGVWIDVADIPVAVSLNHRPGILELCIEDITGFSGFVGEQSRFNEVVVDCADNPTRPLAAVPVDANSGKKCYTCVVEDPLYRVRLDRLIKTCRLDDDGCPDPAPGVPCVDISFSIRNWKGFLNNTNPKEPLILRRSLWLCEGTKNGNNCDNPDGQVCSKSPCKSNACRKCMDPCRLRTSLTTQEINDIAVANQGDSCYAERFRPENQRLALAIAEEEFCLRADTACPNRLRFAVHDDAIRMFCRGDEARRPRVDVHFALVSGRDGVEDMFFWVRDCDTVDLPYDDCGEVGLCYEIGYLERTNDDRKPFRTLFTTPEQILLRKLAVETVRVGGLNTRPDENWLNYYMDIHDISPISVPGGILTGFEVRGSGFCPATKIGICVKGVKLIEPCCCDDDNTFANRAGIPNVLNWTYIFDGGEQCICSTKGTVLVRRSDTQFVDCNTLRVFIPDGVLPLLPARPPCVGVFTAKVFVVDEQAKQCLRDADEYHCPIELALPRPTPGNQCRGRAQADLFCASGPHDFFYGFSRPDFDYARSGIDKFELYDVFAILFFIFGQYERPMNEPVCRDAADANDNGRLDLGDPVTALHMLFGIGSPPLLASPPAFPDLGFDRATPDDLNCGFTADDARANAEDCFGCDLMNQK